MIQFDLRIFFKCVVFNPPTTDGSELDLRRENHAPFSGFGAKKHLGKIMVDFNYLSNQSLNWPPGKYTIR